MQTVVQKDPTIGFSFILQLTGVHGSQQFDKLTKTKTVESILTTMDTSGIKNYIDHLLSQFGEKEGEEQYVSRSFCPAIYLRSEVLRGTWLLR